ncbi:MAG: alanine racemase [Anaerolineae bacterium]
MPDRPAWLEIDMEAIAGNVRAMQALVVATGGLDGGAQGRRLRPVAPIGWGGRRSTTAPPGSQWPRSTRPLPLRDAGIDAPILILGYLPPWQARVAVLRDIAVALYDLRVAQALSAAAQRCRTARRGPPQNQRPGWAG